MAGHIPLHSTPYNQCTSYCLDHYLPTCPFILPLTPTMIYIRLVVITHFSLHSYTMADAMRASILLLALLWCSFSIVQAQTCEGSKAAYEANGFPVDDVPDLPIQGKEVSECVYTLALPYVQGAEWGPRDGCACSSPWCDHSSKTAVESIIRLPLIISRPMNRY